MSYNSTTGIITAPVSIKDVQQALGSSYNDIGRLIALGNINIWAKYKPVRLLNTLDTTGQWDSAQNKWKSSATWMHGSPKSGYAVNNYGLAAHKDSSIAACIERYNAGDQMNGWVYNRPLGGGSSPYRLTDFAGYCSKAETFGDSFMCNNPIVHSGSTATIIATFMYSPDNENAVNPEILLGGTKYFGVALVQNSSVYGMVTSEQPSSSTVRADINGLTVGQTFTVYPFLADNAIQWRAAATSNYFYSLPLLSPVSIRVSSDQEQHGNINVSARYRSLLQSEVDKTCVIVNLVNDDSGAYANVYLSLFSGTEPPAGAPTSDVFSLSAGGTVVKRMQNLSASAYPYQKVRVFYRRYSSGAYSHFDVFIMQDIDT